LTLPTAVEDGHVWNQYVVRSSRRDALREHLASRGIATEIYYRVPLHLQPCFEPLGHQAGSLPFAEQAAREVLALPAFPGLGEARLTRVAHEVLAFFRAG
jgi:dTDP-4-amino-4,6-dideoxygalactose transaminase